MRLFPAHRHRGAQATACTGQGPRGCGVPGTGLQLVAHRGRLRVPVLTPGRRSPFPGRPLEGAQAVVRQGWCPASRGESPPHSRSFPFKLEPRVGAQLGTDGPGAALLLWGEAGPGSRA